jgi:hypothetical protein
MLQCHLVLGGLQLVLGEKRTFYNRACVQRVKPLDLHLVLWFGNDRIGNFTCSIKIKIYRGVYLIIISF